MREVFFSRVRQMFAGIWSYGLYEKKIVRRAARTCQRRRHAPSLYTGPKLRRCREVCKKNGIPCGKRSPRASNVQVQNVLPSFVQSSFNRKSAPLRLKRKRALSLYTPEYTPDAGPSRSSHGSAAAPVLYKAPEAAAAEGQPSCGAVGTVCKDPPAHRKGQGGVVRQPEGGLPPFGGQTARAATTIRLSTTLAVWVTGG